MFNTMPSGVLCYGINSLVVIDHKHMLGTCITGIANLLVKETSPTEQDRNLS